MPRTAKEERVMIPRYIKGHVYEECGQMCAHCGKHLEFFGDFTLEHVIPISKGGTNEKKNFVALCKKCNKDKSNDIIPPMEYFPYLPEAKRKSLQAMFDEYVKSQDWLAQDNLFMMDWFDIHPNRVVGVQKIGRTAFMPVTLKVKRIRDEDAFERLQQHRAYLSVPDAQLIVKTVDAIDTPYYVVEQDGKTVMFFTMYIKKTDKNDYADDWQYILVLDYYITPGLKMSTYAAVPTIFNILQALLHEAQKTLLNGSNGTAILVRLRSPASGPYVHELASFMKSTKVGFDQMLISFGDPVPKGNNVRVAQTIMFQGSIKDLKKIMAEHGATDMRDLSTKIDPKKMQKAIKDRLHSADKIHKKTEA